MSLSKNHHIYWGVIRHRRYTPFKHYFSYPLFMAYLDIENVNSALNPSFLWNVDRPALISFKREDYHGSPTIPLDKAVRNTLKEKTGKQFNGPIRILTHLRYFGYCFNPVSFYYCFDEQDMHVEAILAEVTNTPWNERYAYVIDKRSIKNNKTTLIADFKKKLHVSPFWGMDHDYEWLFTEPENHLFVRMKNYKNKEKVFDATLLMKRKPFTKIMLFKALARFPIITVVVVFRIHWQALKLFLKRAPFFIHPKKILIQK